MASIEIKFVHDKIFLNYWDILHGRDIVCEVLDGKLIYHDEKGFNPEISLLDFIEGVRIRDNDTGYRNIDAPGIKDYSCEDCGWNGKASELKIKNLQDRCPQCDSKNVDRI